MSLSKIRYSRLATTAIVANIVATVFVHISPHFFVIAKGERSPKAVLLLWIPLGLSLACMAALIDNFLPASCGGTKAEERQPTRIFLIWFPAVLATTTALMWSLRPD
jgi:hypothetical protein